MSLQDFIIWVFCWVEDNLTELLQGMRLRSRGILPKLSDAEGFCRINRKVTREIGLGDFYTVS
nr:hypothetical protein [Photorhabdus heterorhabditis]